PNPKSSKARNLCRQENHSCSRVVVRRVSRTAHTAVATDIVNPRPRVMSGLRGSLVAFSLVSGLHLDDVGVGTCTVAVIRPYPIIIGRTRGQPGHVFTSHVTDVQVLVSWYVVGERIVRGHIQPVTSRTVNGIPVCVETA